MAKRKKEYRRARRAYSRPVSDTRPLPVRICESIAEKGIYGILLLVPVTFLSNTYWPFDISKVTLLRILILITLGGYLGRIIAAREWRIVKPPGLLWWPILLYLAVYAISTIFSYSPDLSLQSGEGRNFGLISLAGMILMYFLVINIMTEPKKLVRCLDFFLISTSVVALMGILQDYGHAINIMSSTMGGRASATFGNPDFLFAIMILAVPVAYCLLIRERRPVFQAAYFVAAMLLGWCLLLSMPELVGSEVSLVIALIFPALLLTIVYIPRLLMEKRQQVQAYASLATVIVVFLILLIVFNAGGIRDNFGGYEKRFLGENTDRYMLAEIALDSLPDNPVLGSGPNTFRNTFTEYATLEYAKHAPERREDKVHNSYVEALTTTGWLGFISYVLMQIAIFGYLIVWTLRHRRRPAAIITGWMVVAGIIYMLHTAFMFHTTTPYTFFWILIGIAVSFTLVDNPSVKTLRWHMSEHFSSGILLVLCLLIGLSIFVAVRPVLANAYYFEAERRMNPRNPPSAVAAVPKYEEAIQYNGSEVRYRWSYAIALLTQAQMMDSAAKKQQCEKVREVINEAIEMEPESGMLYYNRGILMAQCGADINEVMADIDKCIEMYPTSYMARQYRAQLHTQMGNLKQAIADDEIFLAIKPGFSGWMRMGNNAISLGDRYAEDDDPDTAPEELYQKAVEALNEAVELKPGDATAQYLLAVAYEKAGQNEAAQAQYAEAIGVLRSVTSENPGNAEGHYMLGFCYERTGELQNARDEYARVLEINPNHQRAQTGMSRLTGG